MPDNIEVMISEEQVNARICELGRQITEEYKGKNLHLVCVLRGAVFFMCELAKRIELPVTFDFMSVSSYGSGTVSSGIVRIIKDLELPVRTVQHPRSSFCAHMHTAGQAFPPRSRDQP